MGRNARRRRRNQIRHESNSTALRTANANPALFTNRVHMHVALDCQPVAQIQNSATEETQVELLALSDLEAVIRSGGIDHALVVAALYYFELSRRARD